jgi:hypothetical protein
MSTESELQRDAADQDALLRGLDQDPDDDNTVQMLQQLTDDDLISSDPSLDNLTSKAIPTANFDAAESHEFRHYLDVISERQRSRVPSDDQLMTGISRQWAHDDPNAGDESITRQDAIIDNSHKHGVAARATKGKEGSLLGLALRSISESVLRRGDADDDGGLLGKI